MKHIQTLSLGLAAGLVLITGGVSRVAAQDNIAAIYQQSYEHEARAELVAALRALESMPSAGRGSYTFALRHGWLLHLNAKYPEAIAAYQTAIRQAPAAIEPRLGLTLPQMALRQWQAIVETTQAILQIDPLQTQALARLALAQYQMGRYQDAEANYLKVLALYPSDVDMQIGVGFCQIGRGAPREAHKTFQALQVFAPRDPRVRDGLAAAQAALPKR